MKADSGAIYECRACGKFRIENIKPLPGDNVLISQGNGGEMGYVEEILPRKNVLVRPSVANIDLLLIVVSCGKPKADLMLADKLLLYAEKNSIDALLCINKTDKNMHEAAETLEKQYQNAVPTIKVSALTGYGIDELKKKIHGKCICMAGQSAVGKSSLLNAISDETKMETGELSKKISRGKHTTRHAELIYIKTIDATVIDTPGFSIFDAVDIEPEELFRYYPDFRDFLGNCRFDTCVHVKEPDCFVKAAVEAGKIDKNRYERYTYIYEELKEKRLKMYD